MESGTKSDASAGEVDEVASGQVGSKCDGYRPGAGNREYV